MAPFLGFSAPWWLFPGFPLFRLSLVQPYVAGVGCGCSVVEVFGHLLDVCLIVVVGSVPVAVVEPRLRVECVLLHDSVLPQVFDYVIAVIIIEVQTITNAVDYIVALSEELFRHPS